MKRTAEKISVQVIKNSLLPVFLLLFFIAGYLFYRFNFHSQASEVLRQEVRKYFLSLGIICMGFFLQRVLGAVMAWYRDNIAAKTKTEFDDKIIPLLRKFLKTAIWVVALLLILPLLGINISALIAALGVASLAIALAAQDTIANIISGFLLLLDMPFQSGDSIKLPSGEIVEVLDIGVRRSRFISREQQAIIFVPNVDLSKSKIVNFTYGKKHVLGPSGDDKTNA